MDIQQKSESNVSMLFPFFRDHLWGRMNERLGVRNDGL